MGIKKLVTYFFRGSLILVPIAATLYILWLVFTTIDDLVPIGIPGAGFVIAVVLITLVGFLTSSVIGKTIFDMTEGFLTRLPLVKLLYTSIKDLVGAFVGDKRRFNKPVAVAISPSSPVRMLGFVTREQLTVLGMPGSVAVYFPQSYNFAGNLLLVPSEHVELLDVPSGDLMTFIVSGGVSGFGLGHSLPPPPPSLPPA
jgi:uncharacterized membrane protein